MFPTPELKELQFRKENVRTRIGLHRQACEESASRVVGPLEPFDHLYSSFKRIAPIAKAGLIPAGLILQQLFLKKGGWIKSVVRIAPVVWGLFRGYRARSH